MNIAPTLTRLREKPARRIVGLMSGTSLDGLDIALCLIAGSGAQTRVELEQFVTVPYPDAWQARLKSVSSVPTVDMLELTLLHTELGRLHGRWIREALAGWGILPGSVDAVASHGQTVFHAPRSFHGHDDKPHATLQIGDGDHIAVTTGILTVSDFRQKFTAVGGEGAPMVPFVDDILFRGEGTRVLLNIGGIANYTVVPPKGSDLPRRATDTGPGNTLIDALVRKHWPGSRYDEDARIGMSAEPDEALLAALLADPWFAQPLPRTTGPEYFHPRWMEARAASAGVALPSPEAQVATATALSARTIAETLRKDLPDMDGATVFYSGGGMHNPLLRSMLRVLLPEMEHRSFSEIGFDPDAKEAVLFAVLANETLAGEGFEWEGRKVHFGKISLP